MKKYLNKNVYEAALERVSFIFDEFKNIYVSFSGGKDSTVCMHLMCEEAKRRNRKIGVLFIDTEAQYKLTINHIKEIIEEYKNYIQVYWICLPMESPNSLSYLEPTWVWWDKNKESIWVREMPSDCINETNNTIDIYSKNMPFEIFVKKFGDWYGQGDKTACIQGIRADESLNRYRAIVKDKIKYKDKNFSTKISPSVYNFYPIYDWGTEDIWIYNGKFNKSYNKLYDLMYKAGLSISQMRVDEPFGNEAKAGLNLFKVIEPDTWTKVVNRVSGANFGNIYHGKKIMNSNYTLPKNHTWKSFTKFLLTTLPPETAKMYKEKFIKFIKYWNKKGVCVDDELVKILETNYRDAYIDTGDISNRGSKNKKVIKFKKIVDEVEEIGSVNQFLTWRRMAMCIIKNDILCKGLCFAPTKDLTVRQQNLIKKYKEL